MPANQSADSMPQAESIRLFLCGDVMTGRGIDQILRHPNDPTLYEPCVNDARSYVKLAERVNGAIPRPVEFDYIWGDALAELDRAGVDLRIVNLETSITSGENYWRHKEIHYRMHPRNIDCIAAARIDCCCLANNPVLDWGYDGLAETLDTLDAAGIAHAGAGRDTTEAAAPAVLDVPGKGGVLVFSYGSPTSGVPQEWAATAERPGVNFLEDISEETAHRIAREMLQFKRQHDVIVTSIHWGGNWDYHIRNEEVRFAHQLIEEGIAVVHGHSSHHVKTAEIYKDRLTLYGCGDFLNDYEGISGYEVFRSDLALMYLPAINPQRGQLVETRLVPMRIALFRLNRSAEADAKWLCVLLNQLGAPLATRYELAPDGSAISTHPRSFPCEHAHPDQNRLQVDTGKTSSADLR
jgi:poly-gamma-glutamate capsule biosynthesis protein CapA/YwtB (metallophosphatase superfamily)